MQRSELVLVVEDEIGLQVSLADLLRLDGHSVEVAASLAEARAVLARASIGLVLLDLSLPDGSGLDLLAEIDKEPLAPAVVVLTADVGVDSAVQAIRRGASDYLTKPFSNAMLRHRIESALRQRSTGLARLVSRRQHRLEDASARVVPPASRPMRRVWAQVAQLAPHDTLPVLVTGETGVGKESISRAFHQQSPRAGEPFVAVNCAELDRGLLRSELFGHEKGAFTGASQRRAGLFELANSGTLMLDEVSELPLEVQALFLRVLEDGSFRRLGGSRELKTAARIVAATNKPLAELVEQGRFRQDLLFRLNTVEVRIPPLRRRPEDIQALAKHFCQRRARALGLEVEIGADAMDLLLSYRWPGNVRELRNVVERGVLLQGGGGRLGVESFDLGRETYSRTPEPSPAGASMRTLAAVEEEHIRVVLEGTGGNRTRAAGVLGISRSTLGRKLARMRKLSPC